MNLRVTLIQGGGTGFDQVPAVKRILEAAGVSITWDEHLAGLSSVEQGGQPLPEDMLKSIRANGLALKTMLLSPPGPPTGNINVQLRRALGVFASVRPLKNVRGLPARFQNVDMLVIRELTEDLYSAIEHEIVPGVVQSIKVVTAAACTRFFRFALGRARAWGRKTVHCVHKANILKLADGLFLEVFRVTAKEFPELQTKEIIVDNCCMQMVLRPQQFDVLVMGNLYGDLVSDLGTGVVGGVSASAGINVGEESEVRSQQSGFRGQGSGISIFESYHGGTREAIGGPDRANPLPLLIPALYLLESAQHVEPARRIREAMEKVLVERRCLTPDLGGQATTSEMTEAVVTALS